MRKAKFNNVYNVIKNFTVKHSPELLIGIGIAGMVTATVLAVKATPDAVVEIENEKRRINNDILDEAKKNGDENCTRITKLTPMDTVKVTWKYYIPAVVTGTVSIACIIGASSVNLKRNAALATAYSLSETALKDYQEKVVETIGDKKEQSIHDSIAKDKLEKSPITQETEVIITGNGETLCYDPLTDRYFKSSMESIRKSVNDVNLRLREENYISLNDFYYELNLRPVDPQIGDTLGWNISENGYVDPIYSSQLTANGIPCLVISYRVGPMYDYHRLY